MTLFLTILGLVIGLISLITVIELFPRLSVSPEPPTEEGNIIPYFSVKNDGYLQLTDVEVACFVWNAHGKGMPNFHNIMSAKSSGAGPEKKLPPTQTLTSRCGINFILPPQAVDEIDLGIILYFRPWPLTLFRSRRVFRFKAQPTANGLNWYKQASGDLEKALDEFLVHFPFPN
jgi:hypothetical protein